MALRSRNRDPHIHGPTPSDFHHVAKPVHAGGFTDKAGIGDRAQRVHMID